MDPTPPLSSPPAPVVNELTTARATQAGGPLLEMVDVAVPALTDPRRIVLVEVNWSVQSGDFWAIGGLHASGKSDFMAVAAGILPPAHGTYRAFGIEPITGFEQERVDTRLRLGLVFDGGQLLHHLTVAENISLPIRYHGNCRFEPCAARVEALLELTGLTGCASQYPGTMSHTRRQRAGLARALALGPEVLLLDSPLSSLDPPDAAWWVNLVTRLAAGHPIADGRPMAVVVTGDDLRPWRPHAKQFAMLEAGRFVPSADDQPLTKNS